ncbi:hypothetical protein B0H66DRAFT_558431 [Apodospora peruviana]|uniref:Uncharacterized protein n=1 Tax=Apodospora peruviana TaxID=516989 RepID=A0AAE0M4R8_9PEZI|nr:hypothetical protein B0H66DRAFT_558431 [Apodospora peruviana]
MFGVIFSATCCLQILERMLRPAPQHTSKQYGPHQHMYWLLGRGVKVVRCLGRPIFAAGAAAFVLLPTLGNRVMYYRYNPSGLILLPANAIPHFADDNRVELSAVVGGVVCFQLIFTTVILVANWRGLRALRRSKPQLGTQRRGLWERLWRNRDK